jgi:hypothetical protein
LYENGLKRRETVETACVVLLPLPAWLFTPVVAGIKLSAWISNCSLSPRILQKETFNNLLKHGAYDENVHKGNHFIIQNCPHLPLTPRSRILLEKHLQFFICRASSECEKKYFKGSSTEEMLENSATG